MNGKKQNFALHAAKSVDGTVTGSVETHSPGQDIALHADVVCMTVIGNMAGIVARITNIQKIMTGVWKVADSSISWSRITAKATRQPRPVL